MTTSARSAASSGSSAAIAAWRRSPVRSMNGTQPTWPQIVAGRKTWLPKAWSKWPWVSTTTVTGSRGQLAQVVDDLARLDVGRARVDDERLAAAQHDPDVLVVERVATHEARDRRSRPSHRHAHGRHGSRASARAGRVRCRHAIHRGARSPIADGTDLLTRHWPATRRSRWRRGGPAVGDRSCWSTVSASTPAATSTSATRWPRPASTSTPTTTAATAAPAGGAATSIAGRSTTTTSPSGCGAVRADAAGPAGRPVRPLDGRPHRRRLPA